MASLNVYRPVPHSGTLSLIDDDEMIIMKHVTTNEDGQTSCRDTEKITSAINEPRPTNSQNMIPSMTFTHT